MKYYVIVFDRDSGGIWDEIELHDLTAKNLKDAKKEAEDIKDEYGLRNITVVLYNEDRKRIAKFVAYKATFL